MKGIIFDFNGTMFLDSHLHEAAWLHMIHDHTKDGLSDEDILKNIHGRTNTEILKHFISEHLTASEIAVLPYCQKKKKAIIVCFACKMKTSFS